MGVQLWCEVTPMAWANRQGPAQSQPFPYFWISHWSTSSLWTPLRGCNGSGVQQGNQKWWLLGSLESSLHFTAISASQPTPGFASMLWSPLPSRLWHSPGDLGTLTMVLSAALHTWVTVVMTHPTHLGGTTSTVVGVPPGEDHCWRVAGLLRGDGCTPSEGPQSHIALCRFTGPQEEPPPLNHVPFAKF